MCFLHYYYYYYDYGGCIYVKGTKLILIAACFVEFTGSHSNFLVCKLQFYTVHFSVFFTVILATTAAKIICKNYRFFFFFLDNFENELQIVFSIAFSIYFH